MRTSAGRVFCIFALVLTALAVSGCTSKPAVDHRFVQAFNEPYTLDSGDRLRVIVFGQDNLTNSYTVDDSGELAMPLVGLAARSRAHGQADRGRDHRPAGVEIPARPQRFGRGGAPSPVLRSRRGQQRRQFAYVSNLTGETAVAIAGGYSPRARKDFILVTRNVDGVVMSEMVPANFPIMPGDTVEVLERWF